MNEPEKNDVTASEEILEYDLEADIYRLLIEEPFFAAISRCVNKRPSRSIPTAGVRITDDGFFDMLYNPAFFAKLPDVQRRGVLKHEFYHLILEHCLARNPDGKKVSRLWNWATDLSINCHLKGELPEFGLLPEKFDFPDFQTAEQYMALLQEKKKDEPENGEGMTAPDGSDGEMDSHEGWGGEANSESSAAAQIARERLREAARKGAQEASQASKGWGTVHEDAKRAIMRFINGTIDWRAVLRNFIGQSQRSNRSNTIKKINRRFPYIHAGKKTERTAHIAIAIDQSGSVSDEMLSLFFSELQHLAKIVNFTVVPFDTETDDRLVYEWKKNDRRPWERVMQGGTDFNAPTDWVNKHPEIDGLLVLTDMQAPVPKPCRVRRAWVTTEECKNSPYFQTNEIVIGVRKMNA